MTVAVRVPALALWPNHIASGTIVDAPCSVLDYLPTVQNIVGATVPSDRPLDGQDMLPLIQQARTKLTKSIPFRYGDQRNDKASLVDGQFKLVIRSESDTSADELYDLSADRAESMNVVIQHPDRAKRMRQSLLDFLASAQASHSGADYAEADYRPVEPWRSLGFYRNRSERRRPTVPRGD